MQRHARGCPCYHCSWETPDPTLPPRMHRRPCNCMHHVEEDVPAFAELVRRGKSGEDLK